MRSPFPGMDPYLEHPALWPDVHNSLIAAIRDALAEQVAPRYYIRLERRTYLLTPDDIVFVGRPDLAIVGRDVTPRDAVRTVASVAVLEVDLPVSDEVSETYLEVHEVTTGTVVTVLELLSPANKLHGPGRRDYEAKRDHVLRTRTNLVEVDLLRAGDPMPIVGTPIRSNYRVLLGRGAQRPRGYLYAFGLRQAIPAFPLPLLPGDPEPVVLLGAILHALYDRARFDLGLDYSVPPVPALADDDAAWARDQVRAHADRLGAPRPGD